MNEHKKTGLLFIIKLKALVSLCYNKNNSPRLYDCL